MDRGFFVFLSIVVCLLSGIIGFASYLHEEERSHVNQIYEYCVTEISKNECDFLHSYPAAYQYKLIQCVKITKKNAIECDWMFQK